MSLSIRDRVKIAAALAMVRDNGADASEITRMAEAGARIGTPPLASYTRAFDHFTRANPAYRAPFMRVGQLVDAIDDRSVAAYHVALDRHEGGDPAALQALMPTLSADVAAMAEQTGDAGFADGLGNVPAGHPQGGTGHPQGATATGGEGLPSGRSAPGWGPEGYVPSQDGSRLSPEGRSEAAGQ